MKDLSNNVILCTWIFFGVVAFSTPNSQEYTGNYTSVSNNEKKGLWGLKYSVSGENSIESNTQWGDINNPSY